MHWASHGLYFRSSTLALGPTKHVIRLVPGDHVLMPNCINGHRDNYTLYNGIITGCLSFTLSSSCHWTCITFKACIHWELVLLFVPAIQLALFHTKILKYWPPAYKQAFHFLKIFLGVQYSAYLEILAVYLPV